MQTLTFVFSNWTYFISNSNLKWKGTALNTPWRNKKTSRQNKKTSRRLHRNALMFWLKRLDVFKKRRNAVFYLSKNKCFSLFCKISVTFVTILFIVLKNRSLCVTEAWIFVTHLSRHKFVFSDIFFVLWQFFVTILYWISVDWSPVADVEEVFANHTSYPIEVFYNDKARSSIMTELC